MRPRALVYEHLSAGGVAQPAPQLAAEGLAMADALLRDLLSDGRCLLHVVRHAELPRPAERGVAWHPTRSPSDASEALDAACRDASFAWIIAPETDGTLESLTRRAAARVAIAGASAEAVAVAASKTRTAAALQRAGVSVIDCRSPRAPPPERAPACRWVVKPDDGAGCEATFVAQSWEHAATLAHTRSVRRPILQPYVEGVPLSLSCLASTRGVRLLSTNRQHIAQVGDALSFEGVTVAPPVGEGCNPAALATRVGAAIPGLRGWFGIDLVLGAAGPQVVEVNPRLTSAYTGLRAALGINAAALILDDLGLVPSSRLETVNGG